MGDQGTFVSYIKRSRSFRDLFRISLNMEIAKMLADPIFLSRTSRNFNFWFIILSTVWLGTGSEAFKAPNLFSLLLLFLSPNFSEFPPVNRGASDPVPNHSIDRIMQQKLKFLEVLDKKIGSANILAISMLSEIRKRSLKERDLFIYDTKVPWSKRRDVKEMLPSPGGQDDERERKRIGVRNFPLSPHDDEGDKLMRKQRQWELFPQDESLEVG